MKWFNQLKQAIETRNGQKIQEVLEANGGEIIDDDSPEDRDCLKAYKGYIGDELIFEYLEYIEPELDLWERSYSIYIANERLCEYVYNVCTKTGEWN